MGRIDTEAQDRADMTRLATGHDAALNSLMERHSGPVFNFLYRMLGNEDDANDLAQETFVRIYRHRERFENGKFTTWLYTIAGNLARNHYRWRSRHPAISLEAETDPAAGHLSEVLPSDAPGPAEDALQRERQQAVRQAISNLPADLREAVLLCEWESLAVAEAAKVLGTTPKAVESRLYRARKQLRELLKRWL
jgi:RNA polymerase sigma-70 factor (ECF subfamily)